MRVLDDDEEDEDAVGAEAVAPFVAPPPLDELPPDAPNESPPPDALVVTDCGAETKSVWPVTRAAAERSESCDRREPALQAKKSKSAHAVHLVAVH